MSTSSTSSKHERQLTMKKASTTTNSVKRLEISEKTRRAYGKRDRALDRDPEALQLPQAPHISQVGGIPLRAKAAARRPPKQGAKTDFAWFELRLAWVPSLDGPNLPPRWFCDRRSRCEKPTLLHGNSI